MQLSKLLVVLQHTITSVYLTFEVRMLLFLSARGYINQLLTLEDMRMITRQASLSLNGIPANEPMGGSAGWSSVRASEVQLLLRSSIEACCCLSIEVKQAKHLRHWQSQTLTMTEVIVGNEICPSWAPAL